MLEVIKRTMMQQVCVELETLPHLLREHLLLLELLEFLELGVGGTHEVREPSSPVTGVQLLVLLNDALLDVELERIPVALLELGDRPLGGVLYARHELGLVVPPLEEQSRVPSVPRVPQVAQPIAEPLELDLKSSAPAHDPPLDDDHLGGGGVSEARKRSRRREAVEARERSWRRGNTLGGEGTRLEARERVCLLAR